MNTLNIIVAVLLVARIVGRNGSGTVYRFSVDGAREDGIGATVEGWAISPHVLVRDNFIVPNVKISRHITPRSILTVLLMIGVLSSTRDLVISY